MAKRNPRFDCIDCGVDTGKTKEYYMLVDSVWFTIFNSKFGMLCIGCVEKRLGRTLCRADFNDSYLNLSKSFDRSARLVDRLNANYSLSSK